MFDVILFEPEIPPNTGNIIRLSANCGFTLHLIHPLGFSLDERSLRRAGLDYHDLAHVVQHQDFDTYLATARKGRLFACSTQGDTVYATPRFRPGDSFLFGPESRGLPDEIRQAPSIDATLRIPMREHSRSLNLANSVSVIVFEAWRQNGFQQAGQ